MASAGVAIMRVVVMTPEGWLGDVVGHLNSRRGRIKTIAPVGDALGVLAFVPMPELESFPDELVQMTQGRARYQIRFSHYQIDGEDPDGGARALVPLKPRSPTRLDHAAAKHPASGS
jgi:translation elongation factor EF-G